MMVNDSKKPWQVEKNYSKVNVKHYVYVRLYLVNTSHPVRHAATAGRQ